MLKVVSSREVATECQNTLLVLEFDGNGGQIGNRPSAISKKIPLDNHDDLQYVMRPGSRERGELRQHMFLASKRLTRRVRRVVGLESGEKTLKDTF